MFLIKVFRVCMEYCMFHVVTFIFMICFIPTISFVVLGIIYYLFALLNKVHLLEKAKY